MDAPGYAFGPFRLIPSRRLLLRHHTPIPLTPKAFDTLVALVERQDRVVTREELLNQLWPGIAVEDANLTQQVFLLRKALDETGTGEQYVATVPRTGYRFVSPVVVLPPRAKPEPPAAVRAEAIWHEPRRVMGALVLLAATAGTTYLAFSRSADLPAPTIRPFATAEGVESMPAWSPDGQTLAYGAEIDGYYQIHIQPVAQPAAAPIPLTNLDADCLFPAWDPTGTRILFLVSRKSLHGELWIVDVAGGEPQRVIDDVVRFAVAPTTGRIAFLRPEPGKVSLWEAGADGRGARRLRRGGRAFGDQAFLAFSPDARWLGIRGDGLLLVPHPFDDPAFERSLRPRFRGPDGEIGVFQSFSWLPGGDEIVFSARNDSGDAQLWVGDLHQLTARPLGASSQWELMPAVSRDGRVAFTTTPMDFDILEIPLESPELRPLVAGARFDGWADWMPSGHELVFSTNRTGRFEIRRRNLDDGVDRVLVPRDVFPYGSTLFLAQADGSSNGTRLAYKGRGLIFMQAILGGQPVRLTDADPGASREDNPSWSPGDRWVLFRRNLTSVMKAPATGHATPTLLAEDSSISPTAEPKWATGGREVVYVSPDGLRRISSNGGPSRIVTREEPLVWDVASDGRTGFAILEGPRRTMRLVRIDLTSGDVRDVANLGRIPMNPMPIGYLATLQGLRVSPDVTRLALSRLNARSDIYIREAGRPDTH